MEMFASQIAAVVLVLAVVFGPALSGGWLLVRRKRRASEERRSPLVKNLLRTPGHGLREQLEEDRLDIAFDLAATMLLPAGMLSLLFATAILTGKLPSDAVLAIISVGVVVVSSYQVRSLLRRSALIDQLRLGLDAELAVGQELDQLMRQGAITFHDMPADKFNIDHVVIAPQGVFAVETKGYRKPIRNVGSGDATVVFDGKALQFPDWASDKPIAQAQRQARWLGEWLSSASGERTEVTPVLALPGWFVERKGRGAVMVLSGPDLQKYLLKARNAHPLSAEQMARLVHQVEQRCRNVKPTYRPDSEQA